uniref:Uncharacterized protein n=1 Tax=Anguilla anguilla TaxID=7936 RepID=A0A0E9X278_ANGAN
MQISVIKKVDTMYILFTACNQCVGSPFLLFSFSCVQAGVSARRASLYGHPESAVITHTSIYAIT